LIFIPVAAASLLICDTTITPAITILGALEGLLIVGPQIEKAIVPLAAVIVILLFSLQFKGTGKVGIFFGPFMIVWFLCIGFIGAYNIFWLDVSSLVAFNPWKAINWWLTGNYAGVPAFAAMGSVILSVTGAETMYADMGEDNIFITVLVAVFPGSLSAPAHFFYSFTFLLSYPTKTPPTYIHIGHFGRPAVLTSFYCLVLPCLFLQYCGQGSYMVHLLKNQASLNLSDDQLISLMNQPFYSAIPKNPKFIYYVMLVVSTVTSVIASEAVIVGCFTYLNQASHLDFFPPLNTVHTNAKLKGQVYIPVVNWALCFVVLVLVFAFRSSSALTALYGTAISTLFLLTSITVFFYVAPLCWGFHWTLCVTLFIIFGGYDAILCSSTLMDKIPAGGWVPLLMAVLMILFMFIWILGKQRSREGYHEMQSVEKTSFPFNLPRISGHDDHRAPPSSASLSEKAIHLAMTPVRWRSESIRDIDAAMDPGRSHSLSFRDMKVAIGKMRSKSKSTPVGQLMDTSKLETVMTAATKGQEMLTVNEDGNEDDNDIEHGASGSADEVKSSGKTLLRSPGVSIYMTSDVETFPIAMLRLASRLGVVPEYAVLCTVHITEDPFIPPSDRVHLCCLDPSYKIYQVEIFFGWAESLSSMTTCQFLKDYASTQISQDKTIGAKPKYRSTVLNAKEECKEELIQLLSHLDVEEGLSASFSHIPDLPIVFFVDDTTYKSKSANFFAKALMYAFHFERKIFGVDPVKHYQLPVNNTIEVGTVVFC
jgi:K+ transporter